MKKGYFDFEIKEGDSTVEDVEFKEKLYGFDKTKPLIYDSSYEMLYKDIINDKFVIRNYSLPFRKFDEKLVRDSINLWDELGIHLNTVCFLDKSYVSKRDNFVVNHRFNDAVRFGHVKHIPIEFIGDKRPNGGCCFFEFDSNDDTNDIEVIIQKIVVPILENKLSSCAYAHELTHSQLINVHEATRSILNIETLPIFIEQLFASEIDSTNRTLLRNRYFRLCQLVENLNGIHFDKNLTYELKVMYDTYNQSTLQAIKLFNTYSFGSNNVKKEMISYINNIFSGKILIEDMLNQFESNLDEVPKELKLLKQIKRK